MKTITWYRAWFNKIEPFELTRFTDKSVFYMAQGEEQRAQRSSDYTHFFPTRDEAKAFLIKQAQKEVERAERNLEYARERLARAEAL